MKLSQRLTSLHLNPFSPCLANHTSFIRLSLVCVSMNACLTHVHVVVIENRMALRDELHCFIHTHCRDQSVGRGNGWDDVLDNSHCLVVVYSFNIEQTCSLLCPLANPFHVIWRVIVNLSVEVIGPFNDQSVLNTVLRDSRCLSNRAHRVRLLLR
jgi:hypothetical protein